MDKTKPGVERVPNTVKILAAIETGCEDLLATLVGLERDCATDGYELEAPETAIRRAMNFAWAMQRFPLFDLGCLSRMKEQKFDVPPRWGAEKPFKGKLFVPAFAWSPFQSRDNAAFEVYPNSMHEFRFFSGGSNILFDGNLIRKNMDAVRAQDVNMVRLESRRPEIPEGVRRRVAAVEGRFDAVNVVWDAEWDPAPLKDPLIVGTVFHRHFLIDQFDVTKLERYIVSEFCTKKE